MVVGHFEMRHFPATQEFGQLLTGLGTMLAVIGLGGIGDDLRGWSQCERNGIQSKEISTVSFFFHRMWDSCDARAALQACASAGFDYKRAKTAIRLAWDSTNHSRHDDHSEENPYSSTVEILSL